MAEDIEVSQAETLQNFWAPLLAKDIRIELVRDGAVLHVHRDGLIELVTLLRDSEQYQFQQLIDITAVDYPGRAERFEVVYQFLSMTKNMRVRVKTHTDEVTPVPTLIPLHPWANWLEREVYDMFGIMFDGHPDLRRILTDYGFVGHPLRKEFPLSGHVEVRYDETQGKVIYEPVKLQQDFRMFEFGSPWEGMTTVQLPGDAKATKPQGWLDRRPLIPNMVEGDKK